MTKDKHSVFLISMQSAFAGLLSANACNFFGLEYMHWAVLSSVLTLSNYDTMDHFFDILTEGIKRFICSVIGVYLAMVGVYLCMTLVSEHYFWYVINLICFIILFCASLLNYTYSGFRIALVSTTLVLYLSITKISDVYLAFDYAVAMLLGVGVAIFVSLIFWPIEQYVLKRFYQYK